MIITQINNAKESGVLDHNDVEKKRDECHGHSYCIRLFAPTDTVLITIIMALLITESLVTYCQYFDANYYLVTLSYKEVFNLQNMEVFHVIQLGKVNRD